MYQCMKNAHWAAHGAKLDQEPDTAERIVGWVDGTAWLIQARLVAVAQFLVRRKW